VKQYFAFYMKGSDLLSDTRDLWAGAKHVVTKGKEWIGYEVANLSIVTEPAKKDIGNMSDRSAIQVTSSYHGERKP
jgi:hypothetical protein